MVINVFCGVVSGVLSSSLANPTDVLKVSLMSHFSLQVLPQTRIHLWLTVMVNRLLGKSKEMCFMIWTPHLFLS